MRYNHRFRRTCICFSIVEKHTKLILSILTEREGGRKTAESNRKPIVKRCRARQNKKLHVLFSTRFFFNPKTLFTSTQPTRTEIIKSRKYQFFDILAIGHHLWYAFRVNGYPKMIRFFMNTILILNETCHSIRIIWTATLTEVGDVLNTYWLA